MKHLVVKNHYVNWTNEVALCLVAVTFVHKYNPQSGASVKKEKTRVWRQKGEGLQLTKKKSNEQTTAEEGQSPKHLVLCT